MQVEGGDRMYQDSKISCEKTGKKKREKDAMVWSDSRRISCLQGVPSNRGTKGNAFRKERGLAYCNTL